MNISSRDFTKWTVQEAVDFLIDRGSNGAICKGCVDGQMYSLRVELFRDE